ncbi:MAG TPA: dolichyl-diphosphooligosaccharide--protein glycosyltransferase subunit 2 [Candidatus Phocaeicola gallinarum]|uniref:DUF4199 domain-containing protein n=1 Tax=Phocaeicola faecium TaxID=2762213 RepID=A0ABR8VAL8_9BACT|nr:hypothetical protein [Phocaeicola faecium]MBD8001825.1 hypothetical protein [Phocaeicola faecium]HJC96553.1 dolichyl-diphosphooligosaccharide--protein glycosyltransferase subunit 2 [Candidatus Phocaeicola gallinarum]
MNALFNILTYSMGSLLLGIILTIAGIGLMFVFVKLWWKVDTFTPMSFICGFILFFFLAFQSVLFCGAVTIKSYCDDIEIAINQIVDKIPLNNRFSQEDSQLILNQISETWPLVGYYVNMADFEGHTPATIAKAMADELRSVMNWFILRRIGWSLLFVFIGAVAIIKSISGRYQSGRSLSTRRTYGGRSVSRPNKQRVNYRRRR